MSDADATIRLAVGTPWRDWCHTCRRTHEWIRVYDADADPDAPPIATAGRHEPTRP